MKKYNKDYYAKAQREWKARNRAKVAINTIKRRCIEQDIPFDLTPEDIVYPEFCPVLGVRIDPFVRERSASIDRLIPELGYVKGNIRVISMRANRLKSDATLNELRALVSYMEGCFPA